MPHATLTINLAAILANYRLLQARLGNTECAAVVKADAYGLGVQYVAPLLAAAGCQTFCVATLEEAIELRALLPQGAIYLFHGVMPGEEALCAEHSITPVLNTLEQVRLWNAYARRQGKRLPAMLHVDTGMCRLGLSAGERMQLAHNPVWCEGVELRYVASHLACADDPAHPLNRQQWECFHQLPAFLHSIPRSLSNSSGIFLGKNYHYELARPGIALYGGNPTPALPNPMQQVVTVSARILQLRDIDSACTVGYGATAEVLPGARIAVVPVGYADGYFRSLGNKAYAMIAGVKVPVIGRVSMDMITVDVSNVPQVYPGAEVELLGADVTADTVAAQAGTISYELLTRLGKRYERRYIHIENEKEHR